MTKSDSVVFSVRMPRELHERLLALAEADDSSLNRTMIVAARRYLRDWEGRQKRSAGAADAR